jgi:hypothetical protein
MRRAPKAVARTLALAAMLAASGVIAGTASASGGRPGRQTAGVQLAYTCQSPSGREHAAAHITVHFPATGTVGKPIAPGTAQVVLTLARAALSAWPGHPHWATVSGTALLTVGISAGGKSVTTAWPGLAVPATHLPAKGTVTLTATGTAPPITPTAPGKVTVTAAGLVAVIKPHPAARLVSPGPRATPGRPNAPAGVRLACTPAPGQNATVAIMPVTEPTAHASRRSAGPHAPDCPKLPPGGLKLNPRFPPPPSWISMGCANFHHQGRRSLPLASYQPLPQYS